MIAVVVEIYFKERSTNKREVAGEDRGEGGDSGEIGKKGGNVRIGCSV